MNLKGEAENDCFHELQKQLTPAPLSHVGSSGGDDAIGANMGFVVSWKSHVYFQDTPPRPRGVDME